MLLFALVALFAASAAAQSTGTITIANPSGSCIVLAQVTTLQNSLGITAMRPICTSDEAVQIGWPLSSADDGASSALAIYGDVDGQAAGCVMSIGQMQAMYLLGRSLEWRGAEGKLFDETAGGYLMDPVSFQPVVCETNSDLLPPGMRLPDISLPSYSEEWSKAIILSEGGAKEHHEESITPSTSTIPATTRLERPSSTTIISVETRTSSDTDTNRTSSIKNTGPQSVDPTHTTPIPTTLTTTSIPVDSAKQSSTTIILVETEQQTAMLSDTTTRSSPTPTLTDSHHDESTRTTSQNNNSSALTSPTTEISSSPPESTTIHDPNTTPRFTSRIDATTPDTSTRSGTAGLSIWTEGHPSSVTAPNDRPITITAVDDIQPNPTNPTSLKAPGDADGVREPNVTAEDVIVVGGKTIGQFTPPVPLKTAETAVRPAKRRLTPPGRPALDNSQTERRSRLARVLTLP